MIRRILLLPHIKVINANALSSPFTIGFPAVTACMGAVHALQRQLNENSFSKVEFIGSGIISHGITLRTYKDEAGYISSIIGSGHPLKKDGNRRSFIEEAKCHLEVSLLIEFNSLEKDREEFFVTLISKLLHSSIKFAGGDITDFMQPQLYRVEDGNKAELTKVLRKLMPGYVLIDRHELMVDAMKEGRDAIDALIDYLAVHNSSELDSNGEISWSSHRKVPGWIVPIATGFQGISKIQAAANQRNQNVPHRFAESIITLGEFRMLHRVNSLDEILWKFETDLENNLYQCAQCK
jgi:CRISPR-associated protein Csy2